MVSAKRARLQTHDPETVEELWSDLDETRRSIRRRDKVPTYMHVPVDDIVIDHRYQRPLHQSRIDAMVKEGWDNVAAEVVTVNLREDGTIVCINGQHRVIVARKLGVKDIECKVFDALTYEEEARAFVRINRERASIKTVDRFRAAIEYRDPEALIIMETVKSCHYTVNLDSHRAVAHGIVAVDALQSIYRWGGVDALKEILGITRRLWPDEPAAVSGIFLKALYTFVHRHRDEVNWTRFYERFSKVTLAQIERAGNRRRDEDPALGASVARYRGILDVYNANIRRKLTPKLYMSMKAGDIAHNSAMLTSAQVYEIRVRLLYLPDMPNKITMLAAEYGVARTTMDDIIHNRTWKEVKVDPNNIKAEFAHWFLTKGVKT